MVRPAEHVPTLSPVPPAAAARTSRRRVAWTALTLAAAIGLLGACSGGDSGTAGSDAGYYDAADGEAYDAAGDAGEEMGGAAVPGGVIASDRSVIQTGYVYATSLDPVAAGADLIALVEAAGGRIESQSIVTQAEHRHPSADLTTRIPSADLTQVLAQIGDVVDVVESELSAQDVTAQVVDLDARIRAKELSIERLEDLLAEATTTADIIAAEETLTQRQTELEQLLTSKKGYSDAIDMATITIYVSMPDQVPVQAPPGFSGGLASGWASLVATMTGLLVVVGFLIPWLLLAAVVVGVVVLVRRARARRRSTTTPPAATPTAVPGLPVPGPLVDKHED